MVTYTEIKNGERVWHWMPPHFEETYRSYKFGTLNKQRFNASIRWVRDILIECGFEVPVDDIEANKWVHYNFYTLRSVLVSGNRRLEASWQGGTLVIEMEGRKKRVEEISDLLDTIRGVWCNDSCD